VESLGTFDPGFEPHWVWFFFPLITRGYSEVYRYPDDYSECLRDLLTPIARLDAEHSCTAAARASPNTAGSLAGHLYMAVGARVMLTTNLWDQKGLFNGAQGTVMDLCWTTGAPPSLPDYAVVHFPGYTGRPWLRDHPQYIPVRPITQKWGDSQQYWRRTLPLHLAWAITTTKTQGLQFPRMLLDLGSKESANGESLAANWATKDGKTAGQERSEPPVILCAPSPPTVRSGSPTST
jgi:hypothetical protein